MAYAARALGRMIFYWVLRDSAGFACKIAENNLRKNFLYAHFRTGDIILSSEDVSTMGEVMGFGYMRR